LPHGPRKEGQRFGLLQEPPSQLALLPHPVGLRAGGQRGLVLPGKATHLGQGFSKIICVISLDRDQVADYDRQS
jgi:hypothetical protein